jgi:hypothetical protein
MGLVSDRRSGLSSVRRGAVRTRFGVVGVALDRFPVLLALVALIQVVAVSPARANHIAGATYNGTHAQGGTVSFTVTPDGSGISSFSVGGPIQGDTCSFPSGSSTNYVQPLPIVNHAFSDTTPPLTESGSFPGPQSASGTFRIKTQVFPGPSCDSGEVAWNATTTASPPAPSQPQLPPSDSTAPAAVLSGKTIQKAGSSIVVEVSCPTEACTATASGTVNVPGASKVYKLKGASANVPKGGKARLKLKVPSKARKAIKRALRRKKKIKAKVTVTARDAAGNKTTRKRTIRLKR